MGSFGSTMSDDGRADIAKPARRWPVSVARLLGAALLALGVGCAALAILGAVTGAAMPLPQWAIARLETQLNTAVRPSLPQSHLAISSIGLALTPDFSPHLVLGGLELRNQADAAIMALPSAEIGLAGAGLLKGDLHLRTVRLSGADLRVTRDANGDFDIAFAAGADFDLAQVFAQTDAFFASPLAENLTQIAVADLSLALRDVRANRTWALGGGTLDVSHDAGDLALNFSMALAQAGRAAGRDTGQVRLAITRAKGADRAEITASVFGVSAQDLALQSAALAFISVLDAPISGQFASTLTPQGISALRARLSIGAGALAPSQSQSPPLKFQSAKMDLSYDPAVGRIVLTELQIRSDSLTLQGGGYADMLRMDGTVINGHLAGEMPSAFAVNLRLDSLRFVQDALFAAPVAFSSGNANLRLTLAPFRIDFDQIDLADETAQLSAKGAISAQKAGWQSQLDLKINELTAAKLLGLWPKILLPGTRLWLDKNLLAGRFRDVKLSLRQDAGAPPVLDLGYHFEDLRLTAMRSLPPITHGAGYGAITGRSFSMVLESGRTAPPQGGDLNLAGSVFTIPDMRQFPATGQLTLQSTGPLTATLSLIDQKPFEYMTKSGRAVDFAQGTARLTTRITLPLKKIITLPEITLQVTGAITDFASDQLAARRTITAPDLNVFVDKMGLRIGGAGAISGVDFEADYVQEFAKAAPPPRVQGYALLSADTLAAFGVGLPKGMITGQGRANIAIDLPRGAAGRMVMTSDLRGIGLQIGAIGFAKGKKHSGDLRAEIALTSPPEVTALTLAAGDLRASGQVRLNGNGRLKTALFDDVTIGKWVAGEVEFLGQDAGAPPKMTLRNGIVDLRYLPPASTDQGSADGMPISVRLEKLRVSDGITLIGFQGDFQSKGGLMGNFAAQLAGGAGVQGQLSPSENGTALRISAQNAGAVLAQAGIFSAVRGGTLDMVLTPQGPARHYLGRVQMSAIRVQNASVLAELLNAVSVVGLLDQLDGPGILFNNVTSNFLLTPIGVEVREGAATGASLGVTMQGAYQFSGAKLDMQGVISPIYVLNGIGEALTRRGEGVLGFNYKLRGTADAPAVRVNPLSVLLPGFFREIFKAPRAKLTQPELKEGE